MEASYLYEDGLGPFAALLHIKPLINNYAYLQPGNPNTYWRDIAKTKLVVNGTLLSIPNLRSGIQRLQHDIESYLYTHLLFHLHELPILNDKGDIFDDLADSSIGYNFIQDDRNFFPKTKWSLVRNISESQELSRESSSSLLSSSLERFFVEDEPFSWKSGAIIAYLLNCAKFMEMLAPLIHLTCGGPARTTEVMATMVSSRFRAATD